MQKAQIKGLTFEAVNEVIVKYAELCKCPELKVKHDKESLMIPAARFTVALN